MVHPVSTTPFFVELFSGSGKLSASMRKRGFKIFPVDHEYNQHHTHVSTICLDLQKHHDQGVLVDMLSVSPVCHLHMGLPCGTCSRAREKALPHHLRHFGAPPPLRSGVFPLGLPGLSGLNKQKVEAANSLYVFAIRVLRVCYAKGITISIENPERSWLWTILTQLVLQTQDSSFIRWFGALEKVSFHSCMHGGSRNKATRLLCSPSIFSSLNAECDNSHPHEPWTIQREGAGLSFATAQEAEYPQLLCARMSDLLGSYIDLPQVKELNATQAARRGLGTFVKKSPPLVTEFSQIYQSYSLPNNPGHKCLGSQLRGENAETNSGETDPQEQMDHVDKKAKKLLKIGVQKTPYEFLQDAIRVNHPMSPQLILPKVMKKAIVDNLSMASLDISKERLKAIYRIRQIANELEEDEKHLKESLEPSIREVLSNKRVLLWEKLLRISNYDDIAVVDLVKNGVPLSGEHDQPTVYPPDWKPATSSVEELLDSAVWRRQSLQSSSSFEDNDVEQKLHEASMEEVKAGHLSGPFTRLQIDDHFGKDRWLFTKRFALMQGTPENPKVRVIDDCRRSGLNSSYTTNFKLELLDLDVLSAALLAIADSIQAGSVDFGPDLKSDVHPSLRGQQWKGRTLDLSKAYKQLPISVESRALCVLGYRHEQEWKYYTTCVLPFGATAAVYGFNRVSRSLHHLLSYFFSIICTCYYDDFPTISPSDSATLVSKCMSVFLNLLGWDHAQVGAKAVDFAEEFSALGVTIQLSSLHSGSFVLANKPSRIEKIVKMLDDVSQSGTLSKAQAAEIQGHLNFASGFFLSKALKFLLGRFDAAAKFASRDKANNIKHLCALTKSILLAIPPRCFKSSAMSQPHVLFTDGGWEDGAASAGLVFYDSSKSQASVQEIEVPMELIEVWKQNVGDQLICQIEMYAYLVARYHYQAILLDQSAIAFIDNEAARFSISKGTATSPSLMAMARMLQMWETKAPTLMWVERVASFSNPADGPSRRRVLETASELGALPIADIMKLPADIVKQVIAVTKDPLIHLPVVPW